MCVIINSNFKTTDLKISILSTSDDLEKEAKAFDERIEERTKAGFIPDVRRAVKCEYFYKSFFRDPYLIKLFLQEEINYFLEMLKKYSYPGARILDVGCGSGYTSLELARSGYHVTGIDISSKVIDVAKKTLESNPFKDGFGSLKYHVSSFDEFDGKFDVVLFCGTIHHIRNPEKTILRALDMLNPTGLLMCEEPSHERWRKQDAAQVALIRSLLSLTGNWYETSLGEDLLEQENFPEYIDDVYTEYVSERDKDEKNGQSPNDNSSNGRQILEALRKHSDELDYTLGVSFIYRTLGGLRGEDKQIQKIASLLATYDKYCVENGFMEPNRFYYIGQKNS